MSTLKELRRKLSRPRAFAKMVPGEWPTVDGEKRRARALKFLENLEVDGDRDFFYVSLHSAMPGEKLENELSYSGYARQAVRFKKGPLSLDTDQVVQFPKLNELHIVTHLAITNRHGILIAIKSEEIPLRAWPGDVITIRAKIELEDLCLP